jgi:hypothetical protein
MTASRTPFGDKLRELQGRHPVLGDVFAASDFNARMLAREQDTLEREAEAKGARDAKAEIARLEAAGAPVTARLRRLRADGQHAMADVLETNQQFALRQEARQLENQQPDHTPEPPKAA